MPPSLRLLPLAGALLAYCAAPVQALELAKYPKVFHAQGGVELVLAPSADGQQALVRVSGINHAIDQVVFLAAKEQRGTGREAYVVELDGSPWTLVYRQTHSYGGGEQYQAFLPQQPQGAFLGYQEEKTQKFQLPALQAAYEQQMRKGVQKQLAQFDRPRRVAHLRTELTQTDAQASEACGHKISTEVDWNALSDTMLKKLSISSYCGAVAAQLRSLCADAPAFRNTAAGLTQVQCQWGSALKLRREGDKLVFTTEEAAPNQDDFVRQYLRNM